jgi:hypothetical protein
MCYFSSKHAAVRRNGRLVQHLPTSKVCKYIICFYLFWTTNKHLRQVLCNPQWIGCVRNSKRTVQSMTLFKKGDPPPFPVYPPMIYPFFLQQSKLPPISYMLILVSSFFLIADLFCNTVLLLLRTQPIHCGLHKTWRKCLFVVQKSGYTGKGGGSPFLNKVIDW